MTAGRLRAIVRALNRGAAALSAAALLGMTGLITLQVVLRRFLDSPVPYSDEVNAYLLVAATVFGLSYAMEKGDHIQVDLGIKWIRASALRWLRVCWCVVGIVFSALLAFQTARYTIESIRLGSVSVDSQTLLWPIQMLLPLGFVLLGLELVVQLIAALARESLP